jgi:hypothetical protein
MKTFKRKLHAKVLRELTLELETARHAAEQAHATATDEENKAENKYDTLGLEAAYLAQGQSQRVLECEKKVFDFNKLQPKTYKADDVIGSLALVELINEHGRKHVFISPAGGGCEVFLGGEKINVVSPQAPLGKALLGKFLGDEVHIKAGHDTNYFEISDLK